jgi:hypothetical protein
MIFIFLGLLVPIGAVIGGQRAAWRGYPRARVWRQAIAGGLIGAVIATVILFAFAILLGIALSGMDDGIIASHALGRRTQT